MESLVKTPLVLPPHGEHASLAFNWHYWLLQFRNYNGSFRSMEDGSRSSIPAFHIWPYAFPHLAHAQQAHPAHYATALATPLALNPESPGTFRRAPVVPSLDRSASLCPASRL